MLRSYKAGGSRYPAGVYTRILTMSNVRIAQCGESQGKREEVNRRKRSATGSLKPSRAPSSSSTFRDTNLW